MMTITQLRAVLRQLVKNEKGAALVEYALLVGLIAVVCITNIEALGNAINLMFGEIATKLAP